MVKLTDKYRTDVAFFRYWILTPMISGTWEGTSDAQFFKKEHILCPMEKKRIIHLILSIYGIRPIQKKALML